VPQLPASLDRFVQYEPPAAFGQALGSIGGHIVVPPPPHTPIWHATPAGQACPQAPQFAGSLVGSAQYIPPPAAAQATGIDGGHPVPPVPPQMPPTHMAPAGHATPQPPQLAGSLSRFVHISPPGPKQPFGIGPPQVIDVPPPHIPFWHATPDGQTMPQFPQLLGSLIMSVQIGPCGLGHIFGLSGGQVVEPPPHIPFWHATPIGQTTPQPPQFAGSLERFVQYCIPVAFMQPLGAVAGQPGPPPHIPFWQATPDGQVMPQPPQFAASDFGSVQYIPPAAVGQGIGDVGGQVVVPPIPVQVPI
jgi:hypothetical protein